MEKRFSALNSAYLKISSVGEKIFCNPFPYFHISPLLFISFRGDGDMKKENSTSGGKILIYFIAVLSGFALNFILMLVFAAVSVVADLGESFAAPFTSLSAAAGSLVSAFIASKKIKSRGLINGLICGGSMFAVIMCVSLAISDGGITLNTLFNFIIIILSALIGGVWGVNGRKKKDYFG